MAPPKSYAESNPTVVPFDDVNIEYVDENGKNVVIRDFEIRPGSGYEILTDDVLNSGNLELLNNFKIDNLDKLNDPYYLPAKKYLDARIRNAERIQAYENKAKLFASQKKMRRTSRRSSRRMGLSSFQTSNIRIIRPAQTAAGLFPIPRF